MNLGEPIATGRTAEIYAYGEGQVVKLLKDGFDQGTLDREADKAAAASEAGVPSPAVLDRVEIDGRYGIVFAEVDGDLLVDDIALAPQRLGHWGRIFADIHSSVLARTSTELPSVVEKLRIQIDEADLPGPQASAAQAQLDVLGEGDRILHGDFHPANVMINEAGEYSVIDWVDASRGHPAADIARTSWLISAATVSDGLQARMLITAMQAAYRRSYLKRILRRTGVTKREVKAWRLPVVAARLSEGVDNEEEALRAEVAKLAR